MPRVKSENGRNGQCAQYTAHSDADLANYGSVMHVDNTFSGLQGTSASCGWPLLPRETPMEPGPFTSG